ncbi:hypothetical protein F4779DRAFT_621582 [Xylariaceae sp. FL0662B]|nr:hypothetical protein F4779DRAFT_621582 [Xylariaceae sp. FL0662B]
MSLIVLVKVSLLHNQGFPAVAESVPADGNPSKRTGQEFDCLTWVEDTLVAADAAGIIRLPVDVDKFISDAQGHARRFATRAETGGGPTVVNEPQFILRRAWSEFWPKFGYSSLDKRIVVAVRIRIGVGS